MATAWYNSQIIGVVVGAVLRYREEEGCVVRLQEYPRAVQEFRKYSVVMFLMKWPYSLFSIPIFSNFLLLRVPDTVTRPSMEVS